MLVYTCSLLIQTSLFCALKPCEGGFSEILNHTGMTPVQRWKTANVED